MLDEADRNGETVCGLQGGLGGCMTHRLRLACVVLMLAAILIVGVAAHELGAVATPLSVGLMLGGVACLLWCRS